MKNKQLKIAGSQKQFRLETLKRHRSYLFICLFTWFFTCVCVWVFVFGCFDVCLYACICVCMFLCVFGASYTFHLLVASHCRPKISAQPNNVQCKIIGRVSYNTSLPFDSFPSSAWRVHNISNNNNNREHHIGHKFLNFTIYYVWHFTSFSYAQSRKCILLSRLTMNNNLYTYFRSGLHLLFLDWFLCVGMRE